MISAPYLEAYFQHYLANAVFSCTEQSLLMRDLIRWIADHNGGLGLEFSPELFDLLEKFNEIPRGRLYRGGRGAKAPFEQLEKLCTLLRSELKAFKKKPDPSQGECFERNLGFLGAELDLTVLEIDILRVLFLYDESTDIENLTDLVGQRTRRTASVFAHFYGLPLNDVRSALVRSGSLVKSGLIAFHNRGSSSFSGPHGYLRGLELIERVIKAPNETRDEFWASLFGGPSKPELTHDDFDHIAEERDLVRRVVNQTISEKTKGVNILIYGPPGTGKTQFCRVIANELGARLFSIGEADEDGDEPSRTDRIMSLQLAQTILSGKPKALMLVDEMEDILSFGPWWDSDRKRGSKVFCNRLLEQNQVPILWTANDRQSVGEPILRRMTLAVEMKTPSSAVRTRIWEKHIKEQGLSVSACEAQRLATEFDASPALAANAAKAAKLAGGSFEDLRQAALGLGKAIGIKPKRQTQTDLASYDPLLLNTDLDLWSLTQQLMQSERKDFSLCLNGPPGTGKSAFVHFLAQKLDMPVHAKKASDILSMWVGGSERNIADAFEEARQQDAILLFDEVDSLLFDRAHAHRSWEITQVNEMLNAMESHDLPFACTTNFMANVDPASLRRFTFKVAFDYLTKAQVRFAYSKFFDHDPRKDVLDLPNLTPGDFAVVAKKAGFLKPQNQAQEIADMLILEARVKPNAPVAIGFRP